MASRPLLGSLVGSLLSSNVMGPPPQSFPPAPAANGHPTTTLQRVVQNLDRCDVKAQGMCCYFPDFCDPLARCHSDPKPANVFELAGSLPKCLCPEGFEGDGRTRGSGCQNVNECERGLAKCEHFCTDLIPGYQCGCRPGFRLNGDGRTCSDIDECVEGTSGCAQLCVNTIGGLRCECYQGYQLSAADGKSCDDIDECAEARLSGYSVCQFDDLCFNLKGTFQCNCPPGLKPDPEDPRRCEDVDECLELENPCPNSLVEDVFQGTLKASQICENTLGGWGCRCLSGSVAVGAGVGEIPGFREEADLLLKSAEQFAALHSSASLAASSALCQDVDECAEDETLCRSADPALPAMCVNYWRSYECVCVSDGTVWDASAGSCVDVDECETDICGHDPNILCVNEVPGYRCDCIEGYTLKGSRCVDKDECAVSGEASCPPHSVCANLDGSYDCVCDTGFRAIRDPHMDFRGRRRVVKCEDVDECELGFCPAPCLNLPGGFVCGCPTGAAAPDAHLPAARATWLALERSIQADVPLDRLSPEQAAVIGPNFQAAIDDIIGCVDIDECALTRGLVCGSGCACFNDHPGFHCECPADRRETVTPVTDDTMVALTLARSLGDHLRTLQMDVIHSRLSQPSSVLKALLTLVPNDTAPWMVTHVPWELSSRLSIEDQFFEEFGPLTNLPLPTLLAIYGDALYRAGIRTCAIANVCLQRQYNPCPQPTRPCCQSRDAGSLFDCLPRSNRLGLKGIGNCPPGTIDRG
eukprot:Protomagalhaensia_sp_Gyna_25__5638@NODE_790_length_2611_cov_27_842146_g621_i0_p1_GENE_NODE_790_length_2611_cov_27_842146_g621_i0NODE_790_length_2611_cov_27_842146_g621_i0_p1_ORF_typecomplete_len755_score100_24EGF_CA/PF07645_15/1_3e02EGF_CA/PF07645_15/8_6e08EGF_CA/PF07645_15/8_8e10EGF_CA/PF07645_15/3e08EGF_CA/PF07645_15/9_6e06EGF_CA/PF07645_15/2_9e05EGF_CA/PF07645_15/2_5e06EGF_CA/PF07645_15/1_5e10EGF_CA/PF07645_15/2_4e07EGF_CA/PF07645_15/2e05EGF_CA/PF07645_15/4e03FXa_inhibition/PF14670_6/19FXa_in